MISWSVAVFVTVIVDFIYFHFFIFIMKPNTNNEKNSLDDIAIW